MDIHERLQLAREHSNLEIADYADAVGVTRQAAQSWEAGNSQPRPGRYAQIAKVSGVRESWLASGEGSMTGGTVSPNEEAFDSLTRDQRQAVTHLVRLFQQANSQAKR